ncbi:porin OmpC [Salmonella enterica subsp. enterica serovar Bovismorbificans]|uniref:Porin n=15 Tax=Salmonella enterica TaxID=28901 RepID=A0A602YIC4_SALMU|nr:porin OmpC [Salmonella enterica]EBW1552037.1 porin OmpC [Salmonella enterica subsp. enterica serovar Hartford]EDB4092432.1 porin OmpC [Salmonella enterica subsp. enterica serovar Typhimurium]EDM8245495.1 phosphoporin PhoE [Salmonella enterica subsp. enterica serovar Litchfield]EDS4138457.1 porin OmpC [Salmonella enterica subsp. enterica serovar Madelia]EDU6028773.1 porin OmpC [Salmonella enterica subsp. enterica serovar Brazil]EDU8306653.1 porin OmpC [Salmonella enterica subsp. enterica se
MKKFAVAVTAVAGAVMAAGMANAAEIYNKDGNKLDLYGKVDGLHYFSSNKNKDGDQSYMRLGFKGETQINEQVTGYGQWEYQINTNRPEDGDTSNSPQSYTRLAFAGLSFGNAGSIDYGRNYGVLYDIGAWTDMLPEFGNDSYENSDNFMTGRANGLLTYRNNGFFGLVDGLNFALQYQGKNDGNNWKGDTWDGTPLSNNSRKIAGQNGDGFGLSATYDAGMGISAGAAYTNSNRTSEQKYRDDGGNKAEAWTAGLKYDANDVYLAANYTQTRNMTWFNIADDSRIGQDNQKDYDGDFAHKTDNWEVVAQYQFDSGLRPSVAYLQSRARNTGYGDFDLVKYADVGATYNFNKNMSAYVDYKINLLKADNPAGLNTGNIVATGLVYQF